MLTCNPVGGNWVGIIEWISMSASKIWIMYWDKVIRKSMATLILVMQGFEPVWKGIRNLPSGH